MAISSGFAGKETREPSCPATLPKGPGSLPREARRAATQEGFAVLEKKAARSTDGSGRGQSRDLGGGFLGRVLVESAGTAHFEQLERAGKAFAPPPEVGRQRRP